MKIEQLLVQHFYNAKEVTLQGLGTFRLSPDFVMPPENDKGLEMPDNAISFEHNTRATEDDALINFIVQQTRKMKPLAAADLDSYLVLGKQFLNIGKPFKIEGLGLLHKNQQGEYQFTQGHSFQTRSEAAIPVDVKEKFEDEDISFNAERKRSGSGKKGLVIAAIIVVAGMIGAAAWYFLFKDKNNKPAVVETPVLNEDSLRLAKATADSLQKIQDSVSRAATELANRGYTFKVVFRVLSKAGAIRKMEELKKSNVIMYTTDSIRYKLAETFSLPLSDTTRIKDSLRLFYDFPTFIELK